MIGALDSLTGWLLTYTLHSTVLLGAAWLITRHLNDRRLSLQEAIWRTALVGALLTATVQLGLGFDPLAGKLSLAAPAVGTDLFTLGTVDSSSSEVPPSNISIDTAPIHRSTRQLATVLTLLWVGVAAAALLGIARARLQLRRLLADRTVFPTGRLIRRLAAAMRIRRSVRVSLTHNLDTPCATGVVRPEICVPDFVISDLPGAEQECLFAHEMAHVARFDPAWLILYHLIERAFFFQPLNRLARQRLEALAECLSDDRAVECTGRQLDLAACLVRIAARCSSPRQLALAAATTSRSDLGQRVERLVHATSRERTSLWTMAMLPAVLAISATVLPGITLSAAVVPAPLAPQEPTPATAPEPEAPPEPESPPAAEAAAEPRALPAPKAPAEPSEVSTVHPPEPPRAPEAREDCRKHQAEREAARKARDAARRRAREARPEDREIEKLRAESLAKREEIRRQARVKAEVRRAEVREQKRVAQAERSRLRAEQRREAEQMRERALAEKDAAQELRSRARAQREANRKAHEEAKNRARSARETARKRAEAAKKQEREIRRQARERSREEPESPEEQF